MDGNHVPVHVGLKPHAMAAKPSEAADERMIGDLGSEILKWEGEDGRDCGLGATFTRLTKRIGIFRYNYM